MIDINKVDCFNAYEFPSSNDFEDAIACASAKRHGVDCIITRNTKDFTDDDIKVYSPDSFLKCHKKPW